MTHPMQDIVMTPTGTIRFKENKIVSFLLGHGGFDMNNLALRDFSDDDRMQFAQLIGYSVSGYGDLSYASPESVAGADTVAERLLDSEAVAVVPEPEPATFVEWYVQRHGLYPGYSGEDMVVVMQRLCDGVAAYVDEQVTKLK